MYIGILIISMCNLLTAMNIIELPSAQEIKTRLSQKGLLDFVNKTDIHTFCAHKKIYPEGAIKFFEVAATTYHAHQDTPKTDATVTQLRKWKPIFIKALLENHPKAIDYLYKKCLLK